jgi:hypothetical protein
LQRWQRLRVVNERSSACDVLLKVLKRGRGQTRTFTFKKPFQSIRDSESPLFPST